MELRDYQTKAANAVIRRLAVERDGGTLLVLPTGTGKTIVFSHVARRWIDGRGERVLVLAHRKELIEQARDKLLRSTDLKAWQVGIERARATSAAAQPVVVGSVQTLSRKKRLERFAPGDFGLVVIDEAHHTPAGGYRRVLEHFQGARRLGVTATPYRLDGANLGRWFESYAYRYEIGQAIADGWLVPIVARRVHLEDLDLSAVRRTAGDFNAGQLAAVMERKELVDEVVQPCLEHAGERPTLVFATSIEHARRLAAAFNGRRPGAARSIDGQLAAGERERILGDFSAGRFQFLVNCELLTEGVDLPRVACVAMARPTQSRALYMQMLGRGTRLLGATLEESRGNGKEDLLVLDFAGVTAKHRAVDVLEVLLPGMSSLARERARKRLAEGGAPFGVGREEEERIRREAEGAAPSSPPAMSSPAMSSSLRPVRYRLGAPVEILRLRLDEDELDVSASDEQVERLHRLGFRQASTLSRSQAEKVLAALRRRRLQGLSTYRQAMTLRRYGLDPDMTFDDAREAIGQIAEAGWPPPRSAAFEALALFEEASNLTGSSYPET